DHVHRAAGQVERDDRHSRHDLPLQGAFGGHGRSSTMANAIPPCAHTETRPNRTARRRISFANVVTTRPPVAPKGWPTAIEPPMTLMMSSLITHPFPANP